MKNNLRTYSLYVRTISYDNPEPDPTSDRIAKAVREIIKKSKTPLKETLNGDLIIAIGGDGTFLQAITETHLDSSKVYVGINTGTLGFLQTISQEAFSQFITYLTNAAEIETRQIPVPSITISLSNGSTRKQKALNEVRIVGAHGKAISFSEYINGQFYQKVKANGVCIASSVVGDTGSSFNNNGVLNFTNIPFLIRTLEAPIRNSAYPNFASNSIMSSQESVILDPSPFPEIVIDGKVLDIDPKKIERVDVQISKDCCIHQLDSATYSKIDTVQKKLLGI